MKLRFAILLLRAYQRLPERKKRKYKFFRSARAAEKFAVQNGFFRMELQSEEGKAVKLFCLVQDADGQCRFAERWTDERYRVLERLAD